MLQNVRDPHHWLRIALMDRGLAQRDIARAWGVDDAVISRFIRTGEPEMSVSRAQTLARLLNMDLTELLAKVPERQKSSSEPEAPAPSPNAETAPFLEELKAAVDKARAAMPGYRISVRITYDEDVAGTVAGAI
jgi:ribosome-binding protein aMBF1 (putative translation factor)